MGWQWCSGTLQLQLAPMYQCEGLLVSRWHRGARCGDKNGTSAQILIRVGVRSMRPSARLSVPGAGSSEERAQEGGSGLGGHTFQPAVHPRAGRALQPVLSSGSRPGLCLLPSVTQSNMGGSQGPWAHDIPALSSLVEPTKPAAGGGGEQDTPPREWGVPQGLAASTQGQAGRGGRS